MTRAFVSAFAAACILLPNAAQAQQQTVVAFTKGTSTATMRGSIKGDQDHSYLVDARAGQSLTVDFKPTNASAYFNVVAPGSDGEAIFVGSSGGNHFSGPVTISGSHRVLVYLMRNAARRNETASYTLTIAITGGAAAKPSRDALVGGTNYNATADISCVTSAGGKPGPCKAGVVRRGNGDATIELKTPDGGERRLFFAGGRAAGSDSAASFNVTRQGDIQIIRIGSIEGYRIPDAFVLGG